MTAEPAEPDLERRSIPRAASAELARRYRDRLVAEERLTSYLLGVANGIGVDTADVQGFDDATDELLVSAKPTD